MFVSTKEYPHCEMIETKNKEKETLKSELYSQMG